MLSPDSPVVLYFPSLSTIITSDCFTILIVDIAKTITKIIKTVKNIVANII